MKNFFNNIFSKSEKNEQEVIVLSENIINNFIKAIYKALLNRETDPYGLKFYSDLIKSSPETGFREVINKVIDSDEFDEKFVGLWTLDRDCKKKELIKDSYWNWIKSNDSSYLNALRLSSYQISSKYKRTDVINQIFSKRGSDTCYLEIGVRNPDDNFNLIKASKKYSVDPGHEVLVNKADFKLESDQFFALLSEGKILTKNQKFDVIFIDGLHLADQVDRDIENALDYIKKDGFVILHDCNPPTEWHARQDYQYHNSPADGAWNGTVWKAFLKRRFDNSLKSCCIDTDWGIGIISKNIDIGSAMENENPFYEFKKFDENRKEFLNLVSFEEFISFL